MEELVKIITDNSISIVCVAYLIYFQSTTMRSMLDTLTRSMLDTLTSVAERLARIEVKIEDNKHDT